MARGRSLNIVLRLLRKDIMKSYLKEYQNILIRVVKSLSKDEDSMVNVTGVNFTLVLSKRISKEQT